MTRKLLAGMALASLLVSISTGAQAEGAKTLVLQEAGGSRLTIQFPEIPSVSAQYSPNGVLVDFSNTSLTFRCATTGEAGPDSDCLVVVEDGPNTNPEYDLDGDGVPNDQDNCDLDFNESQQDTDEDGVGDVCDSSIGNPPTDIDGDGVPNNQDNCDNAYNPLQEDADKDGEGNACDDTPGGNTGEPSAPGAPTNVSATAGNASAVLSWTAPADNGGATITSYTIEKQSGSGAWSAAGTSNTNGKTVTGLTNGTGYVFRVKATNSAGDSGWSSNSNQVTPSDSNSNVTGCPTTSPSGVICDDEWGDSIYNTVATGGQLRLEISNGRTLAVPLRLLEPSTQGQGGGFLTTWEGSPEIVDNASEWTFNLWFSDAPGGDTLRGAPVSPEPTNACWVRTNKPQDKAFAWTQNPNGPNTHCYIGSDVTTIFVNAALIKQNGNVHAYGEVYDFEVGRTVEFLPDGSTPGRRR